MRQAYQVLDEPEIKISENHLLCPINQTVMDDPVIATDGNTYNRDAITAWQAYKGTSPITREPINNVFITNRIVKGLIDEYNAAMIAAQEVEEIEEELAEEVVQAPENTGAYSDWMHKLGQSLSIPNKELWYGSVVEQTLVALADIHTCQVGASFDKEGNGVCFLLKFLNTAEHQRFVQHYISKYAGSILQQGEFQVGGCTKVVLDMQSVYEVITPALGEFRRKHNLNSIMANLATSLNVDFSEVYIGGDAVEHRLVAQAGISTSQKDARYGTAGYCTVFNLNFANKEEHALFLSYYNTNYPNFIIRHDAYEGGKLSKVEVSSRLLLARVAPTLGADLDLQQSSCNLI